MNQYYIGKEDCSIDDISSNGIFENKLFINNGFTRNKEYIFNKFERCSFSKISFNNIKIKNSEFKHSVFIECYFKESDIKQVSFSNCIFIRCGFYDVKLKNCEFFYTEWDHTYIKFEAIKSSLPNEYSYKKRICKVMANNCLLEGNMEEYKKFFFESIKAKENNYKEIILRRSDYYKSKYSKYDSFKYVAKFLLSKLSGVVWGYGEKISNVIYSSVCTVFIYSFIYYNKYDITGIDSTSYINAVYISIANFLNVDSGAKFGDILTKYIGISENILGLVFMGMIVTYLFRSISSR